MIFSIFLLLFCNIILQVVTLKQCCPGDNIFVDEKCRNGINITYLPCEIKLLMGPKVDPPTSLNIEENQNLIVTDDKNLEYLIIKPGKYCLTKLPENELHEYVAIACIDIRQTIYPTSKVYILLAIKAVCALISLIFLLAALAIYLFVPTLQDLEGKCIINLLAFKCGAHLIPILIPIITYLEPHSCNTINLTTYTCLLFDYNWFCVISFNLWKITMRPLFRTHVHWFIVYCCYGYGLPLIMLTTALILLHSGEQKLNVGEFQCWIDGSVVIWGYFYGPILVMLMICIILQYVVVKKVWTGANKTDPTQPMRGLRRKSLIYIHLLLIMAVVQIINVLTFVYLEMQEGERLDYLWQISDCRNMLTGGAIFFTLVTMRNHVLKALGNHGLFCLEFPEKWKMLVDEETVDIQNISDH